MSRRDIVAGQFVRPEKAEAARRLRRDDTSAEHTMWACLRRHNLAGFKFRRQQVIAGFIADFYCAEVGLVVELDGAIHATQTVADAERDKLLTDRGLRLIRFTNDRVDSDLEAVLHELEATLRERSAPPAQY